MNSGRCDSGPAGWSNRSQPSDAQNPSAASLYASSRRPGWRAARPHHLGTDPSPARRHGHLNELNLQALRADRWHRGVMLDPDLLVEFDARHLDAFLQHLEVPRVLHEVRGVVPPVLVLVGDCRVERRYPRVSTRRASAEVDEVERQSSPAAAKGADPRACSTSFENPKYRCASADIEMRKPNMW
jgi:hypothetical protein